MVGEQRAMDGRLRDGQWWLPSTRMRLALRGRFGYRCTDGALDGTASSDDASGRREMLALVRDSDVTFAETVNGTVVARFAANALPGLDGMAEVRVIGAAVAAGALRDALLVLVSSTWMAWDGRREPQPMRLYEMWLDEAGAADAQAIKQDAGARASLERAHWPAVADLHGGILSQTTQVTAIPGDGRRGRSPSASAPSTRPLHTFVYVCTTAAPVAVCLRAHAASAPFHFRLLGASRVAEPPQNSCPRLLRDVSKQLPHWVGCIQCPCSFCALHATVTSALAHCLLLYDNLAYRIRWRLQPNATGDDDGDDDDPIRFWDAGVLHDLHSPDALSSFSDIATNAVNRWERQCRHRLPFRDTGDASARKHSLVLLGVQLPCLNREVLHSDGTAPRAAARRVPRPPWARSAEPDDFVWNLDLVDVRWIAPSTAAAPEPPRVCCLDARHRVTVYVLQPGTTSPVYRRTNPPQRLAGLHPAEDALAFVADDAVVTSFGRRVPFSPPNTASEMASLVPGADVFTQHAVMVPSEHTDGEPTPDNIAAGDALLVTVAERPAASPAATAQYLLRSTTVGMALRPRHFQRPLPGAPARVFWLGVGAVSRLLVAYDMPEQRTVVLRLEVHDGSSSIRCVEDTDADHALETADTTLAVVHLPHSAMAVQVCARSWRVVQASADRRLACRQQVVVAAAVATESQQRVDCLAVHDERLLAYTVGHHLYVYQRAAPGVLSDDTDEVFVPCAAIPLRSTSSCLLLTAECIRVWSWDDAVHSRRIPYRWDADGRFRGIQDHSADGGGTMEASFSYRQVVRAALSLARTGTELLFLEDGAVVVNGRQPERVGGVMAPFETVSEVFHGTVPTSSLFAAGAGGVRLSAAADSAMMNTGDLEMCLVVAGGNVWVWMECADGSPSSSRAPSPLRRRLAPVWVGDPQRHPVRSLTWMPLSHGAEAATLAFVWLDAENMLWGGVLDTSLAARRAERPLSVGEPDRLCYEPITGWVLVVADGGVQAFDPLRLEARGSILSMSDAASSPRVVDVAVPPRAHPVTKQTAPVSSVILVLSDEGFAWYRTVRRGESARDTSWQRLPRTPCPVEGQRQRAVSLDEVGESPWFGRSLVDDCVLLVRATCGGYCFEAWHCPLAAGAQDVAGVGPRCLAHSCRPGTLTYAFDPESRPVTLLAVTEGGACVVYGAASDDVLRPPFRPGQNVELWCNNACDATQWLASANRHLLVQRGAQAEVLAVDVDGSLSPAGSIRAWPMFRHLLSYSFRASWPMRRVGEDEDEDGGVPELHAAAFSDNAWCYLHQS